MWSIKPRGTEAQGACPKEWSDGHASNDDRGPCRPNCGAAEADGTFTVLSPTVDVGTGTHTLVQQMVATEMQEQQGTQCLVLG
jgi:hypothetical protein